MRLGLEAQREAVLYSLGTPWIISPNMWRSRAHKDDRQSQSFARRFALKMTGRDRGDRQARSASPRRHFLLGLQRPE